VVRLLSAVCVSYSRRYTGKDQIDAQGNIVKNVRKAKLTSKELRKKKKERMERRKRGEEVWSDEDE